MNKPFSYIAVAALLFLAATPETATAQSECKADANGRYSQGCLRAMVNRYYREGFETACEQMRGQARRQGDTLVCRRVSANHGGDGDGSVGNTSR